MQPLTETWPGVGDDLKPLKLAIVGCGDIAGYVASIKRLVTQVTLSACCGVHPARAQAFARQHHIPQSFTDYHTLLDMALNSFRGVFGSTHGRAYENTKKWASQEGTTATMKLLFGMGVHSAFDNMSAPAFVLSRYRLPPVLEALAKDVTCTYEKRGWIFARKGEGYLALYSQHPYR